VNNELQGAWEEAFWYNLKHCLGICVYGQTKNITSLRIIGVFFWDLIP
jgi:hypothetical protein